MRFEDQTAKHEPDCDSCEGRGLVWFGTGFGQITCPACGGTGLSPLERKRLKVAREKAEHACDDTEKKP